MKSFPLIPRYFYRDLNERLKIVTLPEQAQWLCGQDREKGVPLTNRGTETSIAEIRELDFYPMAETTA